MTLYQNVQDALLVAAENTPARKELASRGVNSVIVADVVPVAGGYELRAVTVENWGTWHKSSTQHIVRESGHLDDFTCPVCTRQGTKGAEWVAANARGPVIVGLDPESCVGCHDTMTTRGVAPTRFKTGASCGPIPRPE